MPRVLLVSGSPSADSRTAAAVQLAGAPLAAAGHRTDTLAVRDLPPDALLRADTADPRLREAAARVAAADALVIGTPVYRASFSGLLKSWLDVLPRHALRGKAVLPLATGGSLAHALVLDYALRPVLGSMGAAPVTQGCFVLDAAVTRPVDGAPARLDPEASARLARAVTWLGDALPGPVAAVAAA
ncbi:NADPH-dependent FMN reductase [Streptomyces sp. AA0539]|uniref:NADPH-dependent FMN reductase n=1 Tax=Streptomyces sp. AA0539 TaxID=1210045 RepID=UPI00036D9378|nr:NADPH-dependent FMN reductase [Streptomyces sp. AA0539]